MKHLNDMQQQMKDIGHYKGAGKTDTGDWR